MDHKCSGRELASEIQSLRKLSYQDPNQTIAEIREIPEKDRDFATKLAEAEAYILKEELQKAYSVLQPLESFLPSSRRQENLWYYSLLWYCEDFLDNPNSKKTNETRMEWFQKSQNPDLQAYSLFLEAIQLSFSDQTTRSLEAVRQALEIVESELMEHRLIIFLLTLYEINYFESDLRKAKEAIYYFESYDYTLLLEIAYYNLGIIYERVIQTEKAIQFYKKSASSSRQLKNDIAYAYAGQRIAFNLNQVDQYQEAIDQLNKVEVYLEQFDDISFIRRHHLTKGTAYIGINDYNSAEESLSKLEALGVDELQGDGRRAYYILKANVLDGRGELSDAIHWMFAAYNALQDEIDKIIRSQYMAQQSRTNVLVESKRNDRLSHENWQQGQMVSYLTIIVAILIPASLIILLLFILAKNREKLHLIEKNHSLLKAENNRLEKIQLQKSLEDAQNLQESIVSLCLPQKEIPELKFSSYYQAAKQAGGDWFAIFHDEENQVAYIFIADVIGHGYSEALLTTAIAGTCKTVFDLIVEQKHTDIEDNLRRFFIQSNHTISLSGHGKSLMSMFGVALNLSNGDCLAINAGHPLFLFLNDKENRSPGGSILSSGLLGLERDKDLEVHSFSLGQKDTLILYTDGLFENGLNAKPLKQRVLRKALRKDLGSPLKLRESLLQHYHQSLEGQTAEDDCCFLIIEFSPLDPEKSLSTSA